MKQELSQAFHEVLQGLEKGQSLELLLASYPDLADELRALLHTVSAIPNARVYRSEVQAMRSRLDSKFESQVAALDFPKKRSKRPFLALIASIVLVFLGIWIFLPRGDTETVTEITLTQSTEIPSETTIPTSPTPSPSPTSVQSSATPSSTKTPVPPTVSPSPGISPTAAEACVPRSDWPEYRIKSGDTLSQIALNSDTTVEALSLANCIDNPRSLIVGQTIYVPRLWANADSTEQENDLGDDNSGSGSNDDNSGSGSNDDNDSGSGSDDDNSGSGSDSNNSGSCSDDD